MNTLPNHMHKANGRRLSGGFSLIEVMIAMFVMAVGLLGFALLQTLVLRYTQSANYRTQATNLAYDLFDQVRANRLLLAEYSGINQASFQNASGANCDRDVGNFVTPAQNMERWRCQLRAALGPQAWAQVSTQPNGTITVVINWSDARGTVGGDGPADADEGYGKVTVSTRL